MSLSISKWKPRPDADRRQRVYRRQGEPGKQHSVAIRQSGDGAWKHEEDARNYRRNRRSGKFHYHHRQGLVIGSARAAASGASRNQPFAAAHAEQSSIIIRREIYDNTNAKYVSDAASDFCARTTG